MIELHGKGNAKRVLTVFRLHGVEDIFISSLPESPKPLFFLLFDLLLILALHVQEHLLQLHLFLHQNLGPGLQLVRKTVHYILEDFILFRKLPLEVQHLQEVVLKSLVLCCPLLQSCFCQHQLIQGPSVHQGARSPFSRHPVHLLTFV